MYITVYLLKMGRPPKKKKKKKTKKKGKHVDLKMSPPIALLLQVTFTRMHPIGHILLVAKSKEYIYIYIYVVNKWIFALR